MRRGARSVRRYDPASQRTLPAAARRTSVPCPTGPPTASRPDCAARVFGHDSELLLPSEPFLARRIPAGIEPSAILLEIGSWRLMRRMSRAEGQVKKERPLGHQRLGVANETDRAIDDIFRHVIALGDRAGGIDEVIVGGQLGIELIGFSLQEAVVTIEAALQRPIVQRSRRGAFRHWRQMPLSGGKRRVTVVAQNLS